MEAANSKLLYGDLSYEINGILFKVQNEIGRFAREEQYCDLIEKYLQESKIRFKRECKIGDSGNITDFLIEDCIVLEIKAKAFLSEVDYHQVQRYLQASDLQLGILVNFRTRFLQPKRILRRINS